MQLGVVSVYTYPSWLSFHLHDVLKYSQISWSHTLEAQAMLQSLTF